MTPFQLFLKICKNLLKASKTSDYEIKWFTNNRIVVNSGIFQSIKIEKSKGKINPHSLIINGNSIESPEDLKLLGIEIENHLNFESHVSAICKKAVGQLNALSRLKSFLIKIKGIYLLVVKKC